MGLELGLGLGSTPNPNPKPNQVQWAAPEVLLGQGYSHTCDVWSFGVVCWELSTARIPFDGMSLVLVARKVTRTRTLPLTLALTQTLPLT